MHQRDPDPIDAIIDRETRHDHYLAGPRGQRVEDITQAIVSALMREGYPAPQERMVVVIWSTLAAWLYAPNESVAMPHRGA